MMAKLARWGVLVGAVLTGVAWAEPPLHVDDAGTLDLGGGKIEATWRRDGGSRGPEVGIGYGFLPNFEVGVTISQERDRAAGLRMRGWALGIKWAPITSEVGWSFGGLAEITRVRARADGVAGATAETEAALCSLATYRSASGRAWHLTAGVTRLDPHDSAGKSAMTWGAAFEQPLGDRLKFVAEIYGDSRSGPDKAAGLRFSVADGLKVSVLAGRGNGRTIGQLGMAWEF